MNLISQGFRTPKAGSSEADYEDAFHICPDAVAIADGATESSFASAWAQALVEGFACAPLSPTPGLTELMERVTPLQQKWHAGIAWDRLPWFAEDKARNGAFAALLTLQFEASAEATEETAQERRWHALAIGDTCLFQIREDALYLAFPLTESAAFDSSPLLLSSNPARNLKVWDHADVLSGVFKSGDILLLMTDALAKWFLSEVEAGAKPWQTLCALREPSEFIEMTANLRSAHRLKNDDTTLICIQETPVTLSVPAVATVPPTMDGEIEAIEVTPEPPSTALTILDTGTSALIPKPQESSDTAALTPASSHVDSEEATSEHSLEKAEDPSAVAAPEPNACSGAHAEALEEERV